MLSLLLLLLLVLLLLRLPVGSLEGGGVNASASLSRPDVIACPALDVSPCASSYFVVVEGERQENDQQAHDVSDVQDVRTYKNNSENKNPLRNETASGIVGAKCSGNGKNDGFCRKYANHLRFRRFHHTWSPRPHARSR